VSPSAAPAPAAFAAQPTTPDPSAQPSEPEGGYAYVDRALATTDPAEVKLAIKQLKLEKKEIAQVKQEAAAHIAEIRADYSSRVAQRGSMVRGGGTLGKLARNYQRAHRDADRRAVDEAIQPYQAQKEAVDRASQTLDRYILLLERRLLEVS
jgi:hypothetical protein